MDLTEILSNAEDQDRGKWFDLLHPVTGLATGIRLRIAGPDSATQARARVRLVDDLAEVSADDGRISGADRDRVRRHSLARCVLGWEITEDGAPVPFSHANVVRLLRAATWVEAQVDSLAADRRAFMTAT